LDNDIVPDYLLAEQGGICAIANTTCTWLNASGEVEIQLHKIRKQAHWLQQISPNDSWSFDLFSWLPSGLGSWFSEKDLNVKGKKNTETSFKMESGGQKGVLSCHTIHYSPLQTHPAETYPAFPIGRSQKDEGKFLPCLATAQPIKDCHNSANKKSLCFQTPSLLQWAFCL